MKKATAKHRPAARKLTRAAIAAFNERMKREEQERERVSNIPEWLRETPDQDEYMLAMITGHGCSDHLQTIDDITRSEFIALKAYLAEMRGFSFTDPEAILGGLA